MINNFLLVFLIVWPLFFAIILIFLPNNILFIKKIQKFSFIVVLINFFLSLFLWIFFNKSILYFQFIYYYPLIKTLNIDFILGIDGISLFFILLTTFLFPICFLTNWNNNLKNKKYFIILLLILESLLILIFSILDLFLFYIFFELSILPMFFIIGIWGARVQKIKAAYYFFFFTLIGSLLMLIGIILIFFEYGTTNLMIIFFKNFSNKKQLFLWLTFFFSFAIKMPIFPFHIWLPEAHVEAPTVGSIILAGILLKLGGYGFLRIIIPLFKYANYYYYPLIYTISVIGIIYTSLTTIRQIDLKKIIAYSSISHMNYVIIGIFSLNLQAIEGSILLMLGHGIISSALFFLIGILYDRYHTRLIKYYSGLSQIMPLFSLFFLIFSFSNISFPGTANFIGEFLILLGTIQKNFFITFIMSLSIILCAIYSIFLYNRICFGNIKIYYIKKFNDITKKELNIFIPLIFLNFFLGIYPKIFLEYLNLTIKNILI